MSSLPLPEPRIRSSRALVLVILAFFCGALLGASGVLPWPSGQAPAGVSRTFAPFWQAWRLVKKYYVDPESAQNITMTRGAISGMLASLGDVGHTGYLSPEDVKHMEEQLAGNMEGIGATISVRRRQPTILQTLPDSPARKAGLKPGDILLEVDGKSTADQSLQQVVERVRGPAGTVVRLQVLHAGESVPREISITRARVEIAGVAWGMLPGQPIAHIALREFGENADKNLRAALKGCREKGAKAIILDVRGNPGGLKKQAVAVTSEFLHAGEVVFIEVDRDGNREEVAAIEGDSAAGLLVCVLIDGGTASSAEIFAGALQDHKRAKLVGTRTFGTGTVLKPFPLSDGSAILLAVDKWLTPDGREIWHKGISPDVEVQLPEGADVLLPESGIPLTEERFRKSEDKPLHKAFEMLTKQMRDKKRGTVS
jgi:carboxyl-terminal processing protease